MATETYALVKNGKTISEFARREKYDFTDFSDHPTRSNWKWYKYRQQKPVEGLPAETTIDEAAGTITVRPEYVPPDPRREGSIAEPFQAIQPAKLNTILSKIIQRAAAGDARGLAHLLAMVSEIVVTAEGEPETARLDAFLAFLQAEGALTAAEVAAIKGTDFNNVAATD